MLLEVCVDSIESALAAIEGGCSRIELCSALSEGGLTPSPGILKILKAKHNNDIPIFCMLRPRGGNDFIYANDEIMSIIYDIKILKECGADGFVFGALNENRDINIEQCKTILNECGNKPVTFHRAFDYTDPQDMIKNLDLIEKLGFKRVLTSGFKENVDLGLENLKKMSNWTKEKNILILPGGGINNINLERILKQTGLKEFHSSGKKKIFYNAMVSAKSEIKEEARYVTDVEIVANLVQISKNIE